MSPNSLSSAPLRRSRNGTYTPVGDTGDVAGRPQCIAPLVPCDGRIGFLANHATGDTLESKSIFKAGWECLHRFQKSFDCDGRQIISCLLGKQAAQANDKLFRFLLRQ